MAVPVQMAHNTFLDISDFPNFTHPGEISFLPWPSLKGIINSIYKNPSGSKTGWPMMKSCIII